MKSESATQQAGAKETQEFELRTDVDTPFLYAVAGQTPWWIVSVLLHGLVITLAGLMSIRMEYPDEDYCVVVGSIEEPRKMLPIAELAKPQPLDVFRPREDERQTTMVQEGPTFAPGASLAAFQVSEKFQGLDVESFAKGDPLGTETGQSTWLRGYGEPTATGDGTGLGGEGMADLIGLGSDYRPGKNGIGKGDPTGGPVGTFKRRPDPIQGIPSLPPSRRPPAKEWDSVQAALQWLATHQEYDGHWDAAKHGASVKTDTAVTGFALLAFLGVGHSERVGSYKDNVQRAVAWLKSKQAADGCIWDTTDDGAHHRKIGYPCAIATLAMVEATGMANRPDTKAAAQKAIDYCTQVHQSGVGYDKGGWRYAPKEAGDLSVTGWFIMALKSAKVARLDVPAAAFDGAIRFLDSVEVKDIATRSGYGPASRYKYTPSDEHANTAYRLTAIGTLARQFMGWSREELQSTAEWFVNKGGVPSWGTNGEKVDLYYWYYGTLCVFQQNNMDRWNVSHQECPDLWKRWHEGLEKALLEHQCRKGDNPGSWDPVGEFSGEWGRVGQTALSALCLEVYYRYGFCAL
ncbi:MAG: terpene cyclase/mutase family protein [Planctomycetota bacterium]|nr:terpene cyclase/mutase family protein [Planctomycetota bacterium]